MKWPLFPVFLGWLVKALCVRRPFSMWLFEGCVLLFSYIFHYIRVILETLIPLYKIERQVYCWLNGIILDTTVNDLISNGSNRCRLSSHSHLISIAIPTFFLRYSPILVTQLASLYHSICRALDEGKEFQAVHVYFVIFQKLLIEFGTKVFSLSFVRVALVVYCKYG